jgi:hypothetical protein
MVSCTACSAGLLYCSDPEDRRVFRKSALQELAFFHRKIVVHVFLLKHSNHSSVVEALCPRLFSEHGLQQMLFSVLKSV